MQELLLHKRISKLLVAQVFRKQPSLLHESAICIRLCHSEKNVENLKGLVPRNDLGSAIWADAQPVEQVYCIEVASTPPNNFWHLEVTRPRNEVTCQHIALATRSGHNIN
jgi:hypothetical protein